MKVYSARYRIYLGKKYAVWNTSGPFFWIGCIPIAVQRSFPFVKPSEDDFFCLRSGIDWVSHKALVFVYVAACDLRSPIRCHFLPCADQSPSCRQRVWIFFTGADGSGREEEEGSIRSKKESYWDHISCFFLSSATEDSFSWQVG